MGRISQIEKWAHGVDDTINTLSSARMLEASKQQVVAGSKAATAASTPRTSYEDDAAFNRNAGENKENKMVAERIAVIERAIQEKETHVVHQDSTQGRINNLEMQVAELGQQLAPLRLRPVSKEEFQDQQNDSADEVNLNWRLGMLESTLETLSAELTVLQRRVQASEEGATQARHTAGSASDPTDTLDGARQSGNGNDIQAQVMQLNMGLNRLATMVHTCCTKQHGLTEVRMRCDQAASAWGGAMPLTSLRS
eukprot:2051923-Amphidinium_carterae.3